MEIRRGVPPTSESEGRKDDLRTLKNGVKLKKKHFFERKKRDK